MSEVLLTDRAVKDLSKLEKTIARRILLKIKEYSENHFKYSIKLSDPQIGTFRFRIGDYRVIYDFEDNKIVILRIGHRKEIYQ